MNTEFTYGRPDKGEPTEESERERGFFDGLLGRPAQPPDGETWLQIAYDLGYHKGLAQSRESERIGEDDETA